MADTSQSTHGPGGTVLWAIILLVLTVFMAFNAGYINDNALRAHITYPGQFTEDGDPFGTMWRYLTFAGIGLVFLITFIGFLRAKINFVLVVILVLFFTGAALAGAYFAEKTGQRTCQQLFQTGKFWPPNFDFSTYSQP